VSPKGGRDFGSFTSEPLSRSRHADRHK
jgi:hypothetical protein